jgi:hypothetical protein
MASRPSHPHCSVIHYAHIVIQNEFMALNVRLPSSLERELDEWCAAHSTTRTAAVRHALTQLLSVRRRTRAPFELGREGFGSDSSPDRSVARNSQQVLRRQFRGRPAR